MNAQIDISKMEQPMAAPSYKDDRIILIEDIEQLALPQIAKLETFSALLCLQGKGSLHVDGRAREVEQFDLLLCRPNMVLERTLVSGDFRFRAIILSPEYTRKLSLVSGNNTWDIKVFLDNSPVVHVGEEEMQGFCQYYDLLKTKLSRRPRLHHKELIDSLMMACIYELFDVLDQFIQLRPNNYTPAENLFKRFSELLVHTYPRPRRVDWYADRLCVSPKYLSAVCKASSGFTTSELIRQHVVKDIEMLMRNPEKSIKDIAYELDFPNLSFFGKFMKKCLGMSPRAYRKDVMGKSE